MKFRVSHLTRYEYAQAVSFSPHTLYLRPRETPLVRTSRFAFNLSPHADVHSVLDAFGNTSASVHFWDRSDALSIRSDFEVECLETNPFDFFLKQDAVCYPFSYSPYERFVLAPYLASSSQAEQEAAKSWLKEHFPALPGETVALLSALNQKVHRTVRFSRRDDSRIQNAALTLETGIGSGHDQAVALCELCRALGFAARFVSGYVHAEPDDERRPTGMHAWCEVYLPGTGWRGIDPSRGIFCADAHIPVAHAPVPECVSPIQGSYHSAVRVPSRLTTSVFVERLGV